MKTLKILTISAILILKLAGCLDVTSENTNYIRPYNPEADLNGDGIISDEEQELWNQKNIK